MDNYNLLDFINIKSLPEIIIDFLKENKIKTNFTSIRNFYSILLGKISEEIKDSYLNRIQKYMSSPEASSILIFEDIANNIYDENIYSFSKMLIKEIDKSSNSTFLYKQLLDKCLFIYFDKSELENIKEHFEKKNYILFINCLIIHAIKNYKINTPRITAERLFQDALCLYANNKQQNNLLKLSADLGNEIAAQIYANKIYDDYNERLTYFLKGKNTSFSLWEISFILEHFELNNQQLKNVKHELKDIINLEEGILKYLKPINPNNEFEFECMNTAIKIYYYLANYKNFSRGYNSIGKLLLINKIAIFDEDSSLNKDKSLEVAFDYLDKAIKLGNINAMQNLATYYYKNKINDENTNVKELLKIGANIEDLLSSNYFSKILIEEGKLEEAKKHLEYVASTNNGEAQFELGKIYENNYEYDKAIAYYKNAIKNGFTKAAIKLAKLYFNKYMNEENNNNRNSYILYAINIIEDNYNNFNLDEKKEADYLLNNLKKII